MSEVSCDFDVLVVPIRANALFSFEPVAFPHGIAIEGNGNASLGIVRRLLTGGEGVWCGTHLRNHPLGFEQSSPY
jgi:hypothetical protein